MKHFAFLLLTIVFFSCVSKKKQALYLDYKTLDEKYGRVTDSLYAGVGEVTNFDYGRFLTWLRQQGKDSLARLYDFDSTQWSSALGYSEPLVNYYHDHPAYQDYPAVNVSYEGATEYCKWLTEGYNNYPKRKFNKVIFRLPTEQEWVLAARGGRDGSYFPWGGPYMRNSRGIFLANFRQTDESSARDTVINGWRLALVTSGDGSGMAGSLSDNGMITTPSKSYFPNDFGLYNMAGNVSEMLLEKGHTKGGNWNSFGYYLRIDADDEFDGQMDLPSPYVGFRVFAEVVEK